MRHEILLPALGDAESGEVSDWYRQTGDHVSSGEPLCAVDVDKVTIDVPAVESGILTIEAELGSELRPGDRLGWVTSEDR